VGRGIAEDSHMARRLTKAEYLRAVQKPRRRFQLLRLRGSQVSLQQPVPAPCFWFERNDVGEMDGRYWRVPSEATISLVVDGKISALFYLVGRRLHTCTFAYHLTPAELAKAVTVMRRTGLSRLIVPAAEWAIRQMPKERRPTLEAALRTLVRAIKTKASSARGRRRTSGCS
jgi:hypothetical protein